MEQTYTAIETWGGFLAFTDTAEGRGKLRQFLQQTADAYFNPAFNSGALHVYRAEGKLGNHSWVNQISLWTTLLHCIEGIFYSFSINDGG